MNNVLKRSDEEEDYDIEKGDILETITYSSTDPKYVKAKTVNHERNYITYQTRDNIDRTIRMSSLEKTGMFGRSIFRLLKMIKYY